MLRLPLPLAASAALGAVFIVACTNRSEQARTPETASGPQDTASAVASASKIGETDGFRTPESVRYDPELDVYYVSNINGNPSQHDGNGSIVVMRADSTSVVKTLVEGGKNGVTLNGPKGIAIVGDTIWVSDIDAVRAFNRRTGAIVANIDLRGRKATFLNDVVIGGDGDVYVTDTGIDFDANGTVTHPGVDRIFRIAGRTVSEPASGDSLARPNGITWDARNSRFLIAPFGGPDVLSWNPGETTPAKVATGPGTYDGIEVLGDGRILVTSWADSAVHVIRGSSMSVFVAGTPGPADIGVDTKRNILAVPFFNDNKVVFYSIP